MGAFVPRSIEDITQAFEEKVAEQRAQAPVVEEAPAVEAPSAPVEEVPAVEAAPVTEAPPAPVVEASTALIEIEDEAEPIAVAEPVAEVPPSLDEIDTQFIEERIDDEAVADAPEPVAAQPLPAGEVELAGFDDLPAVAADPAAQVAAFDTLKEKPKRSSWFRKLMRFLGTLLWIATVLGLLLATVGFLTRSNPLTTVGDFGLYYQRLDNMEPDVGLGSLVIARSMNPDEGVLGDDILFTLDDSDALGSVALRRVVNVLRANNTTTYDTIALADRENTHEQFEAGQVRMRKAFAVPWLGFLIDQLTVNVWWIIGAFVLSLLLVTLFRPKRHEAVDRV